MEQRITMKLNNVSFITIICALALITSGCFVVVGGDGDTSETTVVTWDNLIWDDGSNNPNTLWED